MSACYGAVTSIGSVTLGFLWVNPDPEQKGCGEGNTPRCVMDKHAPRGEERENDRDGATHVWCPANPA